MDTYEIIITRRAVRQFTADPLPEAVLSRILQAGRWAGSSRNTQPWHFVVVQQRETLEKLAECGKYAGHLRGAAVAIVIATDKAAHRADFDAGRAAQNMMVAAWAEKVGSCIAALHDEACARQLLNIPAEWQVEIAISFGYPDPEAAPTIEGRSLDEVLAGLGRQPLEALTHWEQW